MNKLFFLAAIICVLNSCKKEEFQKCIKEYEKHEYTANLTCDNSDFQFEKVSLNSTILSNEMAIWLNGLVDQPFVVTVANDCSFVANSSEFILLPNKDTLLIQSGSGKTIDNIITIDITTSYDDNCVMTIEKK